MLFRSPGEQLAQRRTERRATASGQRVETFVSDEWTLEYDLAFHGLGKQVYRGASLALADDALNAGGAVQSEVIEAADAAYQALADAGHDRETLGSHIYALFEAEGASKAIAAQYLAELLEKEVETGTLTVLQLLQLLPPYVVAAIAHVTAPFPGPDPNGAAAQIGRAHV